MLYEVITELKEVVNSVVERFKELKIEIDTMNILVFKDGPQMVEFWTGTSESGSYDTTFLIPYSNDIGFLKKAFKARYEGKELFNRITSYNVCYTKLLRSGSVAR